MEALESGHPQKAKKVSATGADCLRECRNTEFVGELRKLAFCEGAWPQVELSTYIVPECPLGELPL